MDDISGKVLAILVVAIIFFSGGYLIGDYAMDYLDYLAEKEVEPSCMEVLGLSTETTDRCLDAWEDDRRMRQFRIFKWEICSGFENCWNCIQQTGIANDTLGDVEWCFSHACDGVSNEQCSEVLDDMLKQYFEAPILGDPT